jgi:hypothetical protein
MILEKDIYERTLISLTAGGRHALSIKDAATALTICQASVWKLVSQEKIRVVRIGGRTTIPATEVARLLCQGA